MLSTAGGIVSRVAVGLYPLARLTPRMGRERGWRQAVQRLPQLSIAHIQMGDVTGPKAPCHLVNGFVSDAGQFEAQQMAHHVIA